MQEYFMSGYFHDDLGFASFTITLTLQNMNT